MPASPGNHEPHPKYNNKKVIRGVFTLSVLYGICRKTFEQTKYGVNTIIQKVLTKTVVHFLFFFDQVSFPFSHSQTGSTTPTAKKYCFT